MRTRTSVVTSPVGIYYDYWGNPTTQMATLYKESAELQSSGHYRWQDPPPDRDVGGNFLSAKVVNSINTTSIEPIHGGSSAYRMHHYDGAMFARTPSTPAAPTGDGSGWGAEAYNRMKPTKPTFSSLNAVYELREVPGMLRQKMVSSGLHRVSNFHLAIQFGWLPLLRDIQSIVSFQAQAQKKLAWLLKHNGKPTRTKAILDAKLSARNNEVSNGDSPLPTFVSYFYNGATSSTYWTDIYDRTWATATWRWFLPDGPRDIQWTRSMMMRLFGLQPTPSVVWNALPWTWLADWFYNTGDVLENMEAGVADRLAAERFYLMREQGIVNRCENRGTYYARSDNHAVPVVVQGHTFSILKTRMKGDPFGYGTKMQDLNATQLGILGALGLSRI